MLNSQFKTFAVALAFTGTALGALPESNYFAATAFDAKSDSLVVASKEALLGAPAALTDFLEDSYDQVDRDKNLRAQIYDRLEQQASGDNGRLYYFLGRARLDGWSGKRKEHSALDAFEKAAKQNDADAYLEMARLFATGVGTNSPRNDYIKAIENAIKLGNQTAKAEYAIALSSSTTKDKRKAVKLAREASDAGNATGTYVLATLYAQGIGGDASEALPLYKKSAERGDSRGMLSYAQALEAGDGVARDLKTALSFYKQSARLDRTASAFLGIGRILATGGDGVTADPAKAEKYLRRVLKMRNGNSQEIMKAAKKALAQLS